jgi:hypothetical protein
MSREQLNRFAAVRRDYLLIKDFVDFLWCGLYSQR